MYRAIALFTDLQDGSHKYDVGDVFPRAGLAVSEERIKELSGSNNKRGRAVIELVEPEQAEPVETVEPTEQPRRGRKKKNDG